jgi:hypothetical protein
MKREQEKEVNFPLDFFLLFFSFFAMGANEHEHDEDG